MVDATIKMKELRMSITKIGDSVQTLRRVQRRDETFFYTRQTPIHQEWLEDTRHRHRSCDSSKVFLTMQ